MQVEPVKKATLTEQVMDHLANQIVSGELVPGERLPDERSLANMFGVARGNIREALRALALIGLVDIRPGGGSFVSTHKTQIPNEAILWTYHRELHNYEDLYDARKLIETAVYLTCYDNRTEELIGRLQEYSEQLLALDINGISCTEFRNLIDEIDTYVGDNCGNGIYEKLMQTMLVLRRDSSLRILSIPSSRQSATLWRVKILKAFNQEDSDHLRLAIDGFFANSIAEITKL
ncbi:FadR/GntR family transcriptional regulator [Olsenella phocaeensis]|uniref:FadR/GntR family transcriptional regulator n=1 Tax=Olsenella phocaeensis TaxID=1852385 RepID=UPI0009309715|nr:GntR family transcriptional regulator [Olsenella phocaeensis]